MADDIKDLTDQNLDQTEDTQAPLEEQVSDDSNTAFDNVENQPDETADETTIPETDDVETPAEVQPEEALPVTQPDGAEVQEDQVVEQEEVPTEPQKGRWYVVHTFAGHENKVATALRQRIEAEHLEDQIFDILVPTQDKIEIRGGKKETVKEKIFPGYILVRMELTDAAWLAVRTTQGVTSFVGALNKPTPISNKEVAGIVKFMAQGAAPTFKDVFMMDDTVKIVDGPFAEFIGKVDSVDKEKGRVRVLVSIFGRETPVELDFLQVQKL